MSKIKNFVCVCVFTFLNESLSYCSLYRCGVSVGQCTIKLNDLCTLLPQLFLSSHCPSASSLSTLVRRPPPPQRGDTIEVSASSSMSAEHFLARLNPEIIGLNLNLIWFTIIIMTQMIPHNTSYVGTVVGIDMGSNLASAHQLCSYILCRIVNQP